MPFIKTRTAIRLIKTSRFLWPVIATLLVTPANAVQFVRTDFHVTTSDGQIAVREVESPLSEAKKKTPIILVHGARVPGVASFDLPVPGGSLAEDLAKSGSSILGNVLIVRSGNDFWSRPADVETLAKHLENAKLVRVLTLPEATHFVHLGPP